MRKFVPVPETVYYDKLLAYTDNSKITTFPINYRPT